MQYSVDNLKMGTQINQSQENAYGCPYDNCLQEYIIELSLQILSGGIDVKQFIDYDLMPDTPKTLKLGGHNNVPRKF